MKGKQRGRPGVVAVMFTHSASAAQGSPVWILGTDRPTQRSSSHAEAVSHIEQLKGGITMTYIQLSTGAPGRKKERKKGGRLVIDVSSGPQYASQTCGN